jgi:hypothetical protein
MIDALVTGRLVNCKEIDKMVHGRIVMDGDKPIQFTARRGVVKSALMALPAGMPIAVSGQLSNWVKFDKDGKPYVHNEILVTAVMTAYQPKGLLASIL